MNRQAAVDVIIVNFRTPVLTVKAVRSVLDEPEVNRVYVVDNDSGDSSLEVFVKELPADRVEIISQPTNIGFGPANNVAAKLATAPYLFFLNSDAWLRPHSLKWLVTDLATDRLIGLVAPAVYLPDEKTLQPDAGGTFPTIWKILARQTRKPLSGTSPDWISGVAFLARREEFLKQGGFNEKLFFYFEDVELCYRYRQGGRKVSRDERASVVHLGGQSKLSTKKQKQLYYRGQDAYFRIVGASIFERGLLRVLRLPYYLLGVMLSWKNVKFSSSKY